MIKIDNYYSMDNDPGYSTQDDSSFQDLFDQFLNDEPTPLSGTRNDGFEDYHAFDFEFEETEPSESSSAESKILTLQSPSIDTSQVRNQKTFALRTQQMLAQPQPQRAAISSDQLLNLEGKVPPELTQTQAPTSSATTAPTLRRKSKFCTQASKPDPEKKPRSKKASRDMNDQGYNNVQNDGPHGQDWTSRFEQISLRQSVPYLQTPSPRATPTYKDKRPSNIQTLTYTPPSQELLPVTTGSMREQRPSVGSEMSQTSRMVPVALSPTIRATQGHDDISPMTLTHDPQARLSGLPLRHADTWSYSPVSPLNNDGLISPFSPDFVVSPTHIVQPSWLHSVPPSNLESYCYNNADNRSSPHSSNPALSAHAIPNLHPHRLVDYNSFVNEDPSSGYSVAPCSNPFASSCPSGSDFTSPHHSHKHRRGHTVVGISHDGAYKSPLAHTYASPPSSPLQHLLHKPHSLRKTRHTRSQKSLSTLRTPKSASSLKPSTSTSHHPNKSNHTLRTAKSTSSSSTSNTTGTSFGFVNFTPEDKGRILTGVAPSGSSKTKARREMEAAEKKRRSSVAALRAVEAMGGDVERFQREVEGVVGGGGTGVGMGE
ncbi:hypothetical protein MMC21_007159 [Puttea exsequens]|nr:hypothetical protein [Puttea exsequens]